MLVAGFLGALGWQGSLSVIQAKAGNGTERNRVFLTAEDDIPSFLHLHLQQGRLLTSLSHCNCPHYQLPSL